MIYIKDGGEIHEMSGMYSHRDGEQRIIRGVYFEDREIWLGRRSAFGRGYWVNEFPWSNEELWANEA